MNYRLAWQKQYIEMIEDAPFLGYGIGTQTKFWEDGVFDGASHIVFYELLIQGGIFYMLSYLYILIKIFILKKHVNRAKISEFVLLGLSLLLMYLFLYSFFSPTLHLEHGLYIIIGLISFKCDTVIKKIA